MRQTLTIVTNGTRDQAEVLLEELSRQGLADKLKAAGGGYVTSHLTGISSRSSDSGRSAARRGARKGVASHEGAASCHSRKPLR